MGFRACLRRLHRNCLQCKDMDKISGGITMVISEDMMEGIGDEGGEAMIAVIGDDEHVTLNTVVAAHDEETWKASRI